MKKKMKKKVKEEKGSLKLTNGELADKEVRIDIYNLEVECEYQPYLFSKWGKRAVRLVKKAKKSKLALERTKRRIKLSKEALWGEYDKDIRRKMDPEKKLTEAGIRSVIQTNDIYLEQLAVLDEQVDIAEDELLVVETKADEALVDKEAFKQRKDMLSHEVFLWGAEYYSSPDITKEGIQNTLTKKTTNVKRRKKNDS